jgi:20S proteasome alpha/beta subunit
MELEVYDDVYQKLVEYVRQMHPAEDSAPPSEKELTTTLNDIVQQYFERYTMHFL